MSQPGFTQSSEAERQYLPPERSGWPLWPWILLLAGSALIFVVRWGIVPSPERRGEQHPAVGQTLTTFQLQPLIGDAKPVSEADLADKVTLVNFWGPWCGPCAMEFPHIVELEAHFRSHPDFQFFSISSNSNPMDDRGLAENTAEFLKRHPADFPIYRDLEAKTLIAFARDAKIENFGFPATVLLGKGGVIHDLWIGYQPGDENDVRRAIEKSSRQAR